MDQRNQMTNPNIDETTIPQTQAIPFFNKTQIIDKLKRYTREQLHNTKMKQYLQAKYKWADSTFNNINWKVHKQSIGKGHTAKPRIVTLKAVHGWRPTKTDYS